MVQLINPASVSGDLTVTLDPATAATQQIESDQLSPGTTNIAAAAYKVEIHNTGLEIITVNSQDVEPGDRFQIAAVDNPSTNRYDMTPALTVVVPANGSAYYVAYRPSA